MSDQNLNSGNSQHNLQQAAPHVPPIMEDTVSYRPTKTEITAADIPTIKVIDKYEVIEELGHGAFGQVYRCLDRFADRHVAVKIFNQQSKGENTRAAEARVNAKINHPQIARLLDHGVLPESHLEFLVFEFASGSTLATLLKQHGAFSEAQALQIIRSICDPLREIHTAGVTHRDLKPGNIIINDYWLATLLDFGVAVHEHTQMQTDGLIAGTLAFMSPEQLQGRLSQLDGRSDLWALGVILYELVTGTRPFPNREAILAGHYRPPSMRVPTVSRHVDKICQQCLQVNVSDRTSSVAQLILLLEKAIHDLTPIDKNDITDVDQTAQSNQPIFTQLKNDGRKRLVWHFLLPVVITTLTGVLALLFLGPNNAEVHATNNQTLAEYVIDLGGEVSLNLDGDDDWKSYSSQSPLPDRPFTVVEIDLRNLTQVDNETLRHLTSLPLLNVASVNLRSTSVTDEGLTYLLDFPNLVTIDLSELKITNAGAQEIGQLTQCLYLNLADTQITDAGIQRIAKLQLKFLDIENLSGVTNASVETLSRMASLQDLKISGTSITPAAIEKWELQNIADFE